MGLGLCMANVQDLLPEFAASIALFASLGMGTTGLACSVLGLLAAYLGSIWVPLLGRTRLVRACIVNRRLKAANAVGQRAPP